MAIDHVGEQPRPGEAAKGLGILIEAVRVSLQGRLAVVEAWFLQVARMHLFEDCP
ncbi:hypothetical protein D3C80_2042120 [compost metagenome]